MIPQYLEAKPQAQMNASWIWPIGTSMLDHAMPHPMDHVIYAPTETADVMSMPIQPRITNIAKIEAVRGARSGVSRIS